MASKHKHPLLSVCLILTSVSLVCDTLAFVLPYWFAKFPQSKNRFLRLGIWEICFNEFMPEAIGNLMYNGCFYLYDPQIASLRSTIFRTWFIVSQVFYTLSFITVVLSTVTLLTQTFNLISPRGPRAVLFSILMSFFTFLFLLIVLITMSAGSDAEVRQTPFAPIDWLQGLDQCGLSWSFGLAAFSIPGCLVTLIIECWFVYPKRSPRGLLMVNAWAWPTASDWLCRYHVNDLHTISKRSHSSNPSRSVNSGNLHTHSNFSSRLEQGVIPSSIQQPPSLRSDLSQRTTPDISLHSSQSAFSKPFSSQLADIHKNNGKSSIYDPRSPDTISLLSYEQLPNTHGSHGDSKLSQTSRMSQHNRLLVRSTTDHSQLALSRVSAKSLAASSESGMARGRLNKQQSADTSVWTTHSISVQAARPMRKTRDSTKLTHSFTSSDTLKIDEESVDNASAVNHQPTILVQSARKMRHNR